MRVGLLTREYPPEVYGGAGVHVEYLAGQLCRLVDLQVHCIGAPRPPVVRDPAGSSDRPQPTVQAHQPWPAMDGANPALGTLSADLSMAAAVADCALVHSHTWYANMAGHWAKLLHGVPHVATVHSLEPLRPWKAEQLGGGYALSGWAERTALESADAVIAVSAAMRGDVLRCYPAVDPGRVAVVPNGVDATRYAPTPQRTALHRHGVDPDVPYVIYVGRLTRQKGVRHLLRAARLFQPAQLVLCAGAADTAEERDEVVGVVDRLRAQRPGVVWVEQMLDRDDVVQLLSHAAVFVCPSVYEPLGIVNLEAMACGTAVVATATGGIPEVVRDGETGFLVPTGPVDPVTGEPADPEGFAGRMAERVNRLLADPTLASRFGLAGRATVLGEFGWPRIADRVVEVYRGLTA